MAFEVYQTIVRQKEIFNYITHTEIIEFVITIQKTLKSILQTDRR